MTKVVLEVRPSLVVVLGLVFLLWQVDRSLESMQAKRARLIERGTLFTGQNVLGDGATLTNSFEAWEWRMFFPRKNDNFDHGEHILQRIIEHVEDLSDLIGFKSEHSEQKKEKRTDVYIDIGDSSVGLKYRGEEKDEDNNNDKNKDKTKNKNDDVLLELKLRKRIAKQQGFFSSRSYELEDWDKLVRKPFDTSEGTNGVVKVLEAALDEYNALKNGTIGERFRYDTHMEELISEAVERARSPSAFHMVKIGKTRFRKKVEFKAKSQTNVFKFEVTSVHVNKDKWWSVAIEGSHKVLCSVFADIALSTSDVEESLKKNEVIFMGYPEFLNRYNSLK
eukprot:Plantae.Rhodophyta-Purpureofilum_apyrenoidigerum.ctg9507.p2 GENE.Plantae.Rhodophyta-Purpureofilum_apyrenoidigerum.ctg9507~~Plantae.Rhodophyta-Purpureofilum_apyrenoidigerum.ctg9507.p2  ORF type:complete len:335 (-),score=75.75 Plantae.Rhodophyta-Purpureofilum_apyrenoidigerum.ctg9507:1605-2609(-)